MTPQEAIGIMKMFTTDEFQRYTSSEFDDAVHTAIEALEKQATIQATSKWIPVSERLPENISTVIVQLKEVEKPTLGWFGNLTGWRLTENDYLGLTGFSVIAWMALPEPWKGESE